MILSAKTVEAVDALQERISSKQWSDFTRTSFVYNTTQTVNALEDLSALFEELQGAFSEEGFGQREEVTSHLNEITSLIELLKRNNDMETSRIKRTREKGIESLADNIIVPDLYSSLEQKVLGMVLKSRYLIERLNIHVRKENSSPFLGTKATKDILDLLNEKEEEMKKLKNKYEKLKYEGHVARLSENTPSDLEHEVNEYARQLQTESKLLNDSFELNKRKLIEMELSHRRMEEKINSYDHIQQTHFERTLDLVTLLKKERDYAKKLVLDIEGETLALRNTYSQKLLGLEEEKTRVKSAAFENFRQKLSKFEEDLKDKTELISNLREKHQLKDVQIKKLTWQLNKFKKKNK